MNNLMLSINIKTPFSYLLLVFEIYWILKFFIKVNEFNVFLKIKNLIDIKTMVFYNKIMTLIKCFTVTKFYSKLRYFKPFKKYLSFSQIFFLIITILLFYTVYQLRAYLTCILSLNMSNKHKYDIIKT